MKWIELTEVKLIRVDINWPCVKLYEYEPTKILRTGRNLGRLPQCHCLGQFKLCLAMRMPELVGIRRDGFNGE